VYVGAALAAHVRLKANLQKMNASLALMFVLGPVIYNYSLILE